MWVVAAFLLDQWIVKLEVEGLQRPVIDASSVPVGAAIGDSVIGGEMLITEDRHDFLLAILEIVAGLGIVTVAVVQTVLFKICF